MAETVSVLLIEDDINDVENVRRAFATVVPPIFQLHHVPRFRDAIQAIRQHTFHVVLLDLGLPDSVGLNGVNRLMAMIPAVPIIVLTGQGNEDSALDAIDLGVQEFLYKNEVDSNRLVRTIRHAIKRKHYALRQSSQPNETAQRKLEELARVVRETGTTVTLRIDSLKQTELSPHQRSLVDDIEKKSKEAVAIADRMHPDPTMFVEIKEAESTNE